MELTLDTPATYRIRVKGYLDGRWSDRLGGLAITTSRQDGAPVVATLYGEVLDQAALAGVLTALYNLHLPLSSLEYLSDVQDGWRQQHGARIRNPSTRTRQDEQ